MLNRMLQGCVVALATASLATVAYADEHENPCGGEEMPAEEGAGGEETPADEGMGGEEAPADEGGGEAAADEGGEAAAAEGEAAGGSSLVVAQGKIKVNVGVLMNLSDGTEMEPVSINPDIVYGVMPKLDVGIYHTPMGLTGFWDGAGGGICVTGEDGGCADVFDGPIGVLANYEVINDGKLAVAANGGLTINSFDPFSLGLKAGIRGQFNAGKIMVKFAPNVLVGLTERDTGASAGFAVGNKEVLNVPVAVGFAINEQLHAGVQTGLRAPFEDMGDFYMVPLSLGAMYQVNQNIGVAATFGFNALINGFPDGGPDAADLRTAGVMVSWSN